MCRSTFAGSLADGIEQRDVDPALKPLLEELRCHLKGFGESATQAHELSEAVVTARAAVDEVLYQELPPEKYDQLVTS